MTKNAYFGPNLAIFGPIILMFRGVSKSFGTQIMKKPTCPHCFLVRHYMKLSFQPSSTVSYSYMTYNLTKWTGGYPDLDIGVYRAETAVRRQNHKSLFLRNEKVFIFRALTVFPGATRGPQAVFGSIGEGRESPRLTSRISCSRFFPI